MQHWHFQVSLSSRIQNSFQMAEIQITIKLANKKIIKFQKIIIKIKCLNAEARRLWKAGKSHRTIRVQERTLSLMRSARLPQVQQGRRLNGMGRTKKSYNSSSIKKRWNWKKEGIGQTTIRVRGKKEALTMSARALKTQRMLSRTAEDAGDAKIAQNCRMTFQAARRWA